MNGTTGKKIMRIDPDDLDDLALEIEKTFAVEFSPEDHAAIRTLGDLCDWLQSRLPPAGACLSSAVFYRLRKALCTRFGTNRETVKPATITESLIPLAQRRAVWPDLQHAIGMQRIIKLRRPKWLSWTVGLTSAALIGSGLFLGAFNLFPKYYEMIGTGFLIAFVGVFATRPFAVCIPDNCKNIGNLVKAILAKDYRGMARAVGRSHPQDLWTVVRAIVASNLGLSEDDLKKTTVFAEF
jgi:hypothetical protein